MFRYVAILGATLGTVVNLFSRKSQFKPSLNFEVDTG